MIKWADYLISAVQYNPQRTHIVNVHRRLDTGNGVKNPNIISRIIVANDLNLGKTYKTIFKNNEGKWTPGEDVKLIGSTGFITTDPNCTTRDNLRNLPEF